MMMLLPSPCSSCFLHLLKNRVFILMLRICDTWTTNVTSCCPKNISGCQHNFWTGLVVVAGWNVVGARACGFHEALSAGWIPVVGNHAASEALSSSSESSGKKWWHGILNSALGPPRHFTSSLAISAPSAKPPSALWQEGDSLLWRVLVLKLGLVTSDFEGGGGLLNLGVLNTGDQSLSWR